MVLRILVAKKGAMTASAESWLPRTTTKANNNKSKQQQKRAKDRAMKNRINLAPNSLICTR
jgi:hypothetical protein